MSVLIFAIVVFGIAGAVLYSVYRSTVSVKGNAGKKSGDKADIKKHTKTSGKAAKYVTDLIPIKTYDAENNVYILEDGVMDIYRINSKDLINANSDEVEYDCLKFAKLYKVYSSDIKILSMNFPCDTHAQQEYFRKKAESASNAVFRQTCEQKAAELRYLESTTSREFYLLTFSKTLAEQKKNESVIFSVLGTGRDGLISKIDADKKHKIFFKLNNKNALVS